MLEKFSWTAENVLEKVPVAFHAMLGSDSSKSLPPPLPRPSPRFQSHICFPYVPRLWSGLQDAVDDFMNSGYPLSTLLEDMQVREV